MLRTCALAASKELQSRFDVLIRRIQFGSALVGIEGIGGLVVARLILHCVSNRLFNDKSCEAYQCSKVVPHLGNVWVESNGTRVRIQSVAVLIDLVVEDTDRAPECRIASIPVNGLLISLVGLGILLLRHVATSQEIPTLSIGIVYRRSANVRYSGMKRSYPN